MYEVSNVSVEILDSQVITLYKFGCKTASYCFVSSELLIACSYFVFSFSILWRQSDSKDNNPFFD